MKQRVDYTKTNPEAFRLMAQLEMYREKTGFPKLLIELIKIRASQINQCAYCLDMHTKDARALGETEQRIYALNAWREAPFYTDEERVVLELTEAVTRIAEGGVSEPLYQRVQEHFDEKQYIDLIYLIVTINGWNRLAVANHNIPGEYQPSIHK